ncbi:MAG: TIGR03067 domain-containing protein [Gemmataceae bacterium]|nr:TIGR03067 domain-containing protein [Gemmataceae bacterium]
MSHRSRTALVACAVAFAGLGGCLTLPARFASDPVARDQYQLQGEWRLAEATCGGQTTRASDASEVRLVVSGQQVALIAVDRKAREARILSEGTFALVPGGPPRAINMVLREQGKTRTRPGIYALEGGRLQLCLAIPVEGSDDAPERPTSFTAGPGQFQIVQTFVRGRS